MGLFKVILIVHGFVNLVTSTSIPTKPKYDLEKIEDLFKEFKQNYAKEYSSKEEHDKRFNIFKENVEKINLLNEQETTHYHDINSFTDMTIEEFTKSRLCENMMIPPKDSLNYEEPPKQTAPKELDWRDHNCVTAIKDQGVCGSCYVFSAIGSIEGQQGLKHKKLLVLSEQQGLDCDTISHGCSGGLMGNTIDALAAQNGSMLGKDYPYESIKGKCHTDQSKIAVKVTGHKMYNISSEQELAETLASVGPLSIAMYVANDLMSYAGGIYDPNNCNGLIDHGVVLVGYGEEKGKPYWIIKNSWGEGWGEKGYLRMVRNKHQCNITEYVVAATIE